MNLDAGRYWDKAWQLVDGCSPVSAGCDNCWSASMTHRFKKDLFTDKGKFNGVIGIYGDSLDLPFKTKKPTVWAVWNDLLHERVPDDSIYTAIDVMRDYECQHHTFLVLTKRPQRVASLLNGYNLANVYWGTSVENQQTADERIPHLLKIPGKRFLSVEPMLEGIKFQRIYYCPCGWKGFKKYGCQQCGDHGGYMSESVLNQISQIICGGETGPNARPCHPDWVRSLRDQCEDADVPFFFKGWGEWAWSESPEMRQFDRFEKFKRFILPHSCECMYKIGHKKAGRLLDGRTHDELIWRNPSI